MRMRKMKNLEPRMEKCRDYQIFSPETYRGKWRELKPDCRELWVEVGCGKESLRLKLPRQIRMFC